MPRQIPRGYNARLSNDRKFDRKFDPAIVSSFRPIQLISLNHRKLENHERARALVAFIPR